MAIEELMTGGTVLRVTRWGEAVMHAETKPVTEFDDDLRSLVADMFATMRAAQGVGLAATQVGRDLSLFVYQCPDDDDVVHHGAICNPVVTTPTGKERSLDSTDEGCLSYPGGYQALARPDVATCTGVDPWGEPVTVRGTGLLARCLQHETDHLNGIVFGDRLSSRAFRKLTEQKDAVAHLYPDDWPVTPKKKTADD
ncbi:peptide deformylase [Propioniciclava soli]|uniref:Peptide deformylase n=2 Tax=Propioniciclava soli TaxID=2775081 RepID=A0ABZ3CC02_9ACTN|nr:peptide deformylase [Propioniciclava soli]